MKKYGLKVTRSASSFFTEDKIYPIEVGRFSFSRYIIDDDGDQVGCTETIDELINYIEESGLVEVKLVDITATTDPKEHVKNLLDEIIRTCYNNQNEVTIEYDQFMQLLRIKEDLNK